MINCSFSVIGSVVFQGISAIECVTYLSSRSVTYVSRLHPLLLRARRGNCQRGCKRACLFRVYVTREKPLVGILYHYRGAVCAGLSALLLISGGGSFNAVHERSVPEDRMNFWMNCTFRVTVSLVLVLTVSVGLLLGRRRSVSCLLKTKNVGFVGR